MIMTTKSILASILAAALLWSQTVGPSATIARDPHTGIITAVVSNSKASRLVCKYAPLPASPSGPYKSLNISCTTNSLPSAAYYVQFAHPFAPGVQAATFGINANGNMAITAIFQPISVVAPGTAPRIDYQIAANSAVTQGVF